MEVSWETRASPVEFRNTAREPCRVVAILPPDKGTPPPTPSDSLFWALIGLGSRWSRKDIGRGQGSGQRPMQGMNREGGAEQAENQEQKRTSSAARPVFESFHAKGLQPEAGISLPVMQ